MPRQLAVRSDFSRRDEADGDDVLPVQLLGDREGFVSSSIVNVYSTRMQFEAECLWGSLESPIGYLVASTVPRRTGGEQTTSSQRASPDVETAYSFRRRTSGMDSRCSGVYHSPV